MALTVVALTVPASNGTGAAVDVHTLDAQKSFLLDGTLGPGETLVVEATEDAAGLVGWTGLTSWSAGKLENQTLNVVAAFLRITRAGSVGGTTPTASVAATVAGVNTYFALTVPALPAGRSGVGASTDVSSGGQEVSVSFHTGLAGGALGLNEALVLEGSNDNVSFVGLIGYTSKTVPGFFELSYKFMRVRRLNSSGGAMSFFVGTATSGGGGGGGFPGFGAAPPQIASAGTAGATGLASDAGHTHEANIVAYTATAAAMQASGVVQQTYAAPTATPVATNMPATRVPFGAAAGTGILDSDQRFVFSVPTATTARAFVVNSGAPPTVANYGGTLTAVESTALGIQAGGFVMAMWSNTAPNLFGPAISLKHGRGTPGAPAILQAGDTLGSVNFMGQIATAGAGGDFVSGVGISAFVQADAVPGAGHLESVFHIFHRNTGSATGDSYLSQQAIGSAANTGIDAAVSVNNAGVAADTSGFVWFPSVAGAQTGVPASTIFLGNVAHRVDTTNQRWYGYIGGAWHFSTYMDYDPTATRIPFGGATAHTLTDASTFTMASGVLTIGSSSAASERPAILLNQATAQALSKTGGTLTIGTTDANPLAFMVNHGQVAYFDNATGALTPNAAVTYDLGSAAKAWTTVYTTIAISPTALSLTGSTSLSLTSGTTSITSDSKTVTIFKTNGNEVFRLQDDSTRVRFAAPSWEAAGSAVGTLTNLPDGTTAANPSDYLKVEFSDGTKRVIPAWFFSNA